MANIIIADDVCDIRHFVCQSLRGYGHDVICVSNGRMLYRILGCNSEKFDLAIVDVSMPVLNGDEGVEMTKLFGIDCKILYITGHDMDEKDGFPVLKKPFTIDELLKAVNDILKK